MNLKSRYLHQNPIVTFLVITCVFSLLLSTSFFGLNQVQAATLQDLQNQQAALEQQAKQDHQGAIQNQTIADRAALKLQDVTNQINQIQAAISSTEGDISNVNMQIDQKNQAIAKLDSNLQSVQNQQNSVVRELYIMAISRSNSLTIFSSEDISKREKDEQQFSGLEKALSALAAETKDAQASAQQARNSLTQKQQVLTAYRNQQNQQQQNLVDVQVTQQALQTNAVATEQQLEAESTQEKAKANQLAQKIRYILSENWSSGGNGRLIPRPQSSWYYSQLDPLWASDPMGDSGYLVGGFGCLITDLAMLAKRHNNSLNPGDIAHNASFGSYGTYIGGDYLSGPNGISESTAGVNWSYINFQLDQGNPVIVRLGLSTYDHFVIIYARSGANNYLIQDPYYATGPGYSTSLVDGYGIVSGL